MGRASILPRVVGRLNRTNEKTDKRQGEKKENVYYQRTALTSRFIKTIHHITPTMDVRKKTSFQIGFIYLQR